MTGHFLQSKEWEGFQRSLGRATFRVDDILIVKLPLVFGKSYLYGVGVPGIGNPRKIPADFLYGAVFIKLEPMAADDVVAQGLLRLNFIKSKKEIQPQKTVVLDLTKSEEELMAGMHRKTRYNIRVAEDKELRIMNYELGNSASVFGKFWELMEKTARRDEFSSHPREYYEKLLELPITKLFTVEYQGKIIAANVVLFYGDTTYYLHGASDYEYRSLMAPYLLHWETIKYAKQQGYQKYDFWGVDEKKWPGVTRFKRGFGGREIEYVGSHDYVFQPFWYSLYGLYRNLKPKT